jgi:hypothetical protein
LCWKFGPLRVLGSRLEGDADGAEKERGESGSVFTAITYAVRVNDMELLERLLQHGDSEIPLLLPLPQPPRMQPFLLISSLSLSQRSASTPLLFLLPGDWTLRLVTTTAVSAAFATAPVEQCVELHLLQERLLCGPSPSATPWPSIYSWRIQILM